MVATSGTVALVEFKFDQRMLPHSSVVSILRLWKGSFMTITPGLEVRGV